VTADANVLVRAAVLDDPAQAAVAQSLLRDAETVALALPALCAARLLAAGRRS
jgi:hypothetical protein